MTIDEIIKQVRWCIDEETNSSFSDLYGGSDSVGDDKYMDNIIRAKINDALLWISVYGPNMLVSDSSSSKDTTQGITKQYTLKKNDEVSVKSADGLITYYPKATESFMIPTEWRDKCGVIELPETFIKIVRVRGNGWHRAILEPISEDSDAYLMLSDDIAQATVDRPQAVLVNSNPKRIEIFPGNCDVELTIVCTPSNLTEEDLMNNDKEINIPSKSQSSFIYYIAFLVESAYGDTKANTMLAIAKMNLGLTEK